ncbi:hypothetical protein GIB67_032095, partial [Kingdonia uniflora]
VFEKLQKLIGTKNELSLGLSWTLIRCLDQESNILINTPLKRTEFNSKLVVVISLMDECFMPTFYRRSGIHMIQSVLYNCGSNFNRFNYRGFYTAILERGDEIITASSIRYDYSGYGQSSKKEEQEGLRSTCDEKNMFSREDYKTMPFTQYVINETLRLGGIAIWLMRTVKEDVEY